MAAETKECVRKPEILDYLIRKQGSSSSSGLLEKNRLGQIPLHIAVLNENQLSVDLILQSMKTHHATNIATNKSPSSSLDDSSQAFRAWLADNMTDSDGLSPLHYSARLNNLPVSLLLISFGFDLGQKTTSSSGSTDDGLYPHDLCTDPDVRLVLYGIYF